jgi:hypothetical protein
MTISKIFHNISYATLMYWHGLRGTGNAALSSTAAYDPDGGRLA